MQWFSLKNTYEFFPIIILYNIFGLFGIIFFDVNWIAVLLLWLFYAFGNGTVGHRYFAHNSFIVGKKTHWLLGFWVTLCAYSPVHYWVVQHKHHHRHTDTEHDLHAPRNGILNAFILWPFNKSRVEQVFKERSGMISMARAIKDPSVVFYGRWFLLINLTVLLLLLIIDWQLIFNTLGVAYLIEQIRLGLINTVTHLPSLPGNYTNHEHVGTDQSQNNWILGLVTLGFGWHNNHHADPKKLILTERWWEIDLEGYLGWVIGLTGKTITKTLKPKLHD